MAQNDKKPCLKILPVLLHVTFSILIYSNNHFEMLSCMIGHKRSRKSKRRFSQKNSWDKLQSVIWIKLPQIYATSYLMIYSTNICEMLTNMMWCNRYKNVTFEFIKIFPFGENWQFSPNLAQDYATLQSMMWSKDLVWDVLAW